MNRDDGGVSRRRLMAAGAAGWATVSLAGCSDTGGDGDGGTTTTTEDGDDVTVTSQTTTTESADTPTTTASSDGGGGGGTTSCSGQNVFAMGMDVGFLVDVYDDLTGSRLFEDAIDAVTISFPNSELESVELTPDGPHEKHVDDKWGGKLSVPADAEPGTHTYEIAVSRRDGAEETVVTDELTLVDHSL
ncbi:MAG: hypothetical protein ABEJ77_04090 [Halanaeroarchaeum sp.]